MTTDTSDPYVGWHKPSGELVRIGLDIGLAPEDGQEEFGYIVHRIPDLLGLTEEEWFLTKVWTSAGWTTVDPKPNNYASWNAATSSWVWDVNDLLQDIRPIKNALLAGSDWTQMPDAPITEAQVLEAQTYRQQLRDLTETITSPPVNSVSDVVWPTPPSFLT